MVELIQIIDSIINFVPFVRTLVTVIIAVVLFNIISNFLRKKLLKVAKTKKQISDVEIFTKLLQYFFIFGVIIIAILSYAGSFTGLGLGLGLFSAALGWALQRPITGIAAWVLIVMKRPFDIGDRIIIGSVRGDVVDVTLTHIYISEIGGLVSGEETSGRIILVPNATFFEQSIINYTSKDEYVLDQVMLTVTYESDIDKATRISLDAAKKITNNFSEKVPKKPYIRTYFQANGLDIYVRYFSPAKKLQKISSSVTQEIYKKIIKTKNVEFAYPHRVLIQRKK